MSGTDFAFHYTAQYAITQVQCKAWCDSGGTACVGYSWREVTQQCSFHKRNSVSVVPNHAGGNSGTAVSGTAQNGVPNTGTSDHYWTCHPRTSGSAVYENWLQPPVDALHQKDCVKLRHDGRWFEANCMEKRHFICERNF